MVTPSEKQGSREKTTHKGRGLNPTSIFLSFCPLPSALCLSSSTLWLVNTDVSLQIILKFYREIL
jgi:hypothetical protein